MLHRQVLSYHFSRAENAAYYVLKSSDLDYYFKVAEYRVEPVTETMREKLVQAKTEEGQASPLELNVTRGMTMQAPLKSTNLMLTESLQRRMSR